MAANLFGEDDTESAENWDACWCALESLPSRNDLPNAVLKTQAAKIINSCRALTEGRGIEHIEERARNAYRLAVAEHAAGKEERLSRVIVVLGGALSVLRRYPR